MKKVLISVFLLGVVVLPAVVFGALPTTITGLGTKVVNAIWTVAVVITVCCFLLSGIMFAMAQGDPQKISLSKAAFIGGIVGAVVILISASILPILFGWLN
ncbi:MAG: hypothetical protein AAB361_03600 [Patescibacteria group bacterium]